ncbi:MAG: hypothetical protein WDZ50_08850 [Woeseia sp.]
MNDTDPKIDAMVTEKYRQMTPFARVKIASDMFDSARAIVDSSLPSNLTRFERRLAFIRRLYGDELPERAMIAFAGYGDDGWPGGNA